MDPSDPLQGARDLRRAMLGDEYVDSQSADPNPGQLRDDLGAEVIKVESLATATRCAARARCSTAAMSGGRR